MNKLDEQYRGILAELLYNGKEKEDRTGTGTLSKFGMQIRHNMKDGFPLLTTKKIAVKTMMTELKWFLKGDTNIKYLVDNGCDEFAKKWGELGPIYGKQWRKWKTSKFGNLGPNDTLSDVFVDQIKNLINGLKYNPNSRRHMVSAWNVGELGQMTLPPCHHGFQCYVADGKLSLMWSQRSVDTFLGLPFNIASYGMLLMLLCEETGYEPGDLIGNLGDVHLYNNHWDQAKEQIDRDGFDLPTIKLSNVDILNGDFEYKLENYKHRPAIRAPLSN